MLWRRKGLSTETSQSTSVVRRSLKASRKGCRREQTCIISIQAFSLKTRGNSIVRSGGTLVRSNIKIEAKHYKQRPGNLKEDAVLKVTFTVRPLDARLAFSILFTSGCKYCEFAPSLRCWFGLGGSWMNCPKSSNHPTYREL